MTCTDCSETGEASVPEISFNDSTISTELSKSDKMNDKNLQIFIEDT